LTMKPKNIFLYAVATLAVNFMIELSPVHAFEIKHVDYSRRPYFVINGGVPDGIVEGHIACVFDEYGEKLFCTPVYAVKEKRTGAYAPEEYAAWVKEGLFVKIEELGDIAANQPKKAFISRSSLEGGEDAEEAAELAQLWELRKQDVAWTSSYLVTPMLPYRYSHPQFAIDSRMAGTGSLWDGAVPVSRSLAGVALSRRAPLSIATDHEFVLQWRYIKPVQSDADYDPSSGSVYAQTKSSALDAGIGWNWMSAGRREGFSIGWQTGLSYELMNLNFASSVVDDGDGSQSGDLAQSKASIAGMLTRIGTRIDYKFSDSGGADSKRGLMSFAVNGVIPMSAKAKWTHGDHLIPSDTTQRDDSKAHFEEAVALKKASFALETALVLGVMF
jgi:hypothetical protein